MNINSGAKPGSPTSLKCGSRSVLDESSPQKNDRLSLSHIIQYLDKVENILISTSERSPAMKYQHCYPGDDGNSFYKSAGFVFAKPMLRTLICGDVNVNINDSSVDERYDAQSKKIVFDQRTREARARIEGQKMYSFAVHSLRPAAQSLDAGVRNEMVPELLERIDALESRAENRSQSPINWTSGTKALFTRLASGRRYKGKLERLVSDLFPDLLDEFHDAFRVATEREVFEFLINKDLVNDQKVQCEDDEGLANKRIDAAFKCLSRFYPLDTEHSHPGYDRQKGSEDGRISGKECEESCMDFLHKGDHYKVLRNVYVNARRNSRESKKYIPPKIERKMSANKKVDTSGIIWTACLNGSARHKLCSEFDAVVLSSETYADATNAHLGVSVSSIWEAKKTMSPSSLHDILSKKLVAIEALLDDAGSELVYGNDGSTETIPFSTEGMRLTFGIFCSELQRPAHAADSIRSIACSNVVNYNMMEVIRSLDDSDDTGDVMVKVDLSSALKIVHGLRSLIEEIQDRNRTDVTFFVDENVDFL